MAKSSYVVSPSPTALDALRGLVAADLKQVDRRIVGLIESKAELIPQMSAHTISAGGKRLRPILTLACSRMCKIERDCHIDLAAAVEFIHTATLLHDDVVDQSDLRRGLSTANQLWGNKESILVGDFLLGKAFALMGAAESLDVYRILSNASVIISEGEVLQLACTSNLAMTEALYLQVVSSKTAELFAAACEIGAVMANRPAEEAAALRQFGLNLGIAFQIADDMLDYSAHQETLGKRIGDDFRERKMTLPVIYAYERGAPEAKAFWQRTIGKGEQSENDVRAAIALINSGNILADVAHQAHQYAAIARDALNVFPRSEIKSALMDVLDFVVAREY